MEVSRNEMTNDNVVVDDDKYRYDYIMNLHKGVKEDELKYERTYKKYRKANRVCTGIGISSNFIATSTSLSAISTALTGIGLVVAMSLGVLSGICYGASIFVLLETTR